MSKHVIDRLVEQSLSGRFPVFVFLLSFLLGAFALYNTPREEEPQIVVPMVDVHVEVPNLKAKQIERQVTIHLETLLKQVAGVEHIYSVTQDNQLVVTLRFHVGENRENALLNTYNKLYSSQDRVPPVVSQWQVKPIEVDDVAILMMGLYSTNENRYSDFELRRFAEEIANLFQQVENTSVISVTGGRPRELQVLLDTQALTARNTSAQDVVSALLSSNSLADTGDIVLSGKSVNIKSGDVFNGVDEIKELVVNVVNGNEVLLKDIAQVVDGPSEVEGYQWLETSDNPRASYPMVSISVAKQKGSNAVAVADDVLNLAQELQKSFLPDEVKLHLLRNYGETADEKVNNLTSSLVFAVFTVVVFVGVFLGWRSALVVGLTVPVCYGLTLFLDWVFGYSINRVTLFALILSLGLLVDDPITGIDNIVRFLGDKGKNKPEKIVAAMSEIRPALIMSTITIMLAFIPLAFITGMMGPYMAPMAFNVPVSVVLSTLIAFLVTPWLAKKLLTTQARPMVEKEGIYRRLLSPLLENKLRSKQFLLFVLALFLIACLLPVLRAVPLKLLPFDNKNEVQVLIDLPEDSALETTANLVREVSARVLSLKEVESVGAYVGYPSSIDFNGLVRQYYRRHGDHLGELRVVLNDKKFREHQSHGVVLRLREHLKEFNQHGVKIKVVEVPPGPPVMSTLVAEVYKEPFVSTETQREAAEVLRKRLAEEPHVTETDTSITANEQSLTFVTDKLKATASGISTKDINQTLILAIQGINAGTFQRQMDTTPVPIRVKVPFEDRNNLSYLQNLHVIGQQQVRKQVNNASSITASNPFVALGELGNWNEAQVSQPIYRKDLVPVIYVTAELNGRTPAEVIADVNADNVTDSSDFEHSKWSSRTFLSSGGTQQWQLPKGTWSSFSGEGEWRITIDVFRDMGIAFAFALVGIFFVLQYQTKSNALALIIMSSIPLTVIGIMPGFWLLNQFGEREIAGAPEPILFTATAMIGMIALAGIVVRNSLILIEFINLALKQGAPLKDALLKAGHVRMRPVLLTAMTTMLGNLVIILDPVFSGLALAIIFGIVASTIFSLFVVPIVYYLVFSEKQPLGVRGC